MKQTVTRKPYLTDLTDTQWELLGPLLQLPDGGAPKTTESGDLFIDFPKIGDFCASEFCLFFQTTSFLEE